MTGNIFLILTCSFNQSWKAGQKRQPIFRSQRMSSITSPDYISAAPDLVFTLTEFM